MRHFSARYWPTISRAASTPTAAGATVAVDDRAIDARGARRALALSGGTILATDLTPFAPARI